MQSLLLGINVEVIEKALPHRATSPQENRFEVCARACPPTWRQDGMSVGAWYQSWQTPLPRRPLPRHCVMLSEVAIEKHFRRLNADSIVAACAGLVMALALRLACAWL